MAYGDKTRDELLASLDKSIRENVLSLEQVGEHASWDFEDEKSRDMWLVIDGIVVDVSEYANEHPGGPDKLVDYAGKDATDV